MPKSTQDLDQQIEQIKQKKAQQTAKLDKQLAQLRTQKRKQETGQKVILGGLTLNTARHNAKYRKWLRDEIAQQVKREADLKRLAPLLAEFDELDKDIQP